VIKGLGAGLAAATVPATVSARGEPSTAATEVGIDTAVNKLLANGKTKQARQLLEKHGVPYTANEKQMPPTGVDTEETDEVTIQDQWTKSASTLYHYSYLYSGDQDSGVFQSSIYWDLNQEGNYETDGPDDGAGITVNPDLWEVVLNSWEFDNKSSLDQRGSKGVIVKYDDPGQNDTSDVDTTGYLRPARTISTAPTRTPGHRSVSRRASPSRWPSARLASVSAVGRTRGRSAPTTTGKRLTPAI
jgi:hypothetical protein